ncbi:hypothetical protein TNCV_3938961 [Trichonephila clavipes]|nr:hypothetical protein TNCV_3938961 [Trichonephila clavipes]
MKEQNGVPPVSSFIVRQQCSCSVSLCCNVSVSPVSSFSWDRATLVVCLYAANFSWDNNAVVVCLYAAMSVSLMYPVFSWDNIAVVVYLYAARSREKPQ